MSLAKISALLALLLAAVFVALALLTSWAPFFLAWQPTAAAGALATTALFTMRGSQLGLKSLIAVWALLLGTFVSDISQPPPPPNPNTYSVDSITGFLILSVPLTMLVGLVCAVLHKEQK